MIPRLILFSALEVYPSDWPVTYACIAPAFDTCTMDDHTLRQIRNKSLGFYNNGQIIEAIKAQLEVVNARSLQTGSIQDHRLLALYLSALQDYSSAVRVLEGVLARAPEDGELLSNLGVCLIRKGQPGDAVAHLAKAALLCPQDANILDALAHAYGALGDRMRAREWGEKALLLKDRQASGDGYALPQTPPPAFAFDRQNVISFSLWGTQGRYIEGALRNAALAKDIYPGWTCRFYVDHTVPLDVPRQLTELGAAVVFMPGHRKAYEGLFWRFAVAHDRSVERFLIRDADSLINTQERVAVDEWIESESYFHVMRDFYTHTELILAGMWGGVGGILPDLSELQRNFKVQTLPTANLDQLFLRSCVWPTVRKSCLIHDSWFRVFGAKEFPSVGRLEPGRHVGQNHAVFLSNSNRNPTSVTDRARQG